MTADSDPQCIAKSHVHDSRCVTSAHLSIFEKYHGSQAVGCDNPKKYIKRFIDKAFDKVLDKWAPFIIDVQVSLGRLNEPTYPDANRFWCYDDAAVASYHENVIATADPPKEADLETLDQDPNLDAANERRNVSIG